MKKLTTEEFIKRAREVHGDKYDYSLVDYKNMTTKIKIICPVHGVFEQRPSDHLRGDCIFCAGKNKLTTEEFIKRAKEVHGDKYDYSLVEYKGIYEKVKIICPVHGVFEQSPNKHLNAKHRCPICSKGINSTKEFIKKAKEIHGNKYDYSLVDYKNTYQKVKIICPVHGVFEQSPSNHLNKTYPQGCPFCSHINGNSKGEVRIKKILESKKIEFIQEFYFNDLKDKNFLRFDFYIPSKKILIEYQGEQHYKAVSFSGDKETAKQELKIQRHHDWLKRKYAKNNGYKLLTIPHWDYKIIKEILEEEL